MRNNILYLFALLFFTTTQQINAQSGRSGVKLEIKNVQLNEKENTLDVYFSFKDASSSTIDIRSLKTAKYSFSFNEVVGNQTGKPSLTPVLNSFKRYKGTESFKSSPTPTAASDDTPTTSYQAAMTMYIALDLSGSVTPDMLESAKQAISNIFSRDVSGGKIYLYTFEDKISEAILLTRSNYKEVFAEIKAGGMYPVQGYSSGALFEYFMDADGSTSSTTDVKLINGVYYKSYDTDLHGAIVEKVNELENLTKKQNADTTSLGAVATNKVLIFLTDGVHDANFNPKYHKELGGKDQYDAETVKKTVRNSDVTVYTIGLGDRVDQTFLKDVAGANGKGKYYFAKLPENLGVIYENIKEQEYPDYKVSLKPGDKDCVYRGLVRTLTIKYSKEGERTKEDSYKYREGSSSNRKNICGVVPIDLTAKFMISLGVGFGLLLFLFVSLALLFPFIRKLYFKSKYVNKYIKETNIDRDCPYCGNSFNHGEKVVSKCDHLMHQVCWAENNNQCTEYPDLCNKGYEEVYGFKDFLNGRRGSEIALWAFMGSIGGMLAWLCYSLIPYEQGVGSFIKLFTPSSMLLPKEEEGWGLAAQFVTESFQGVLLGFFLTLVYSIVENKKAVSVNTILMTLLRSVIGAFVGFAVFFVAVILCDFVPVAYFHDMIPILLFGPILGMVLSIKSSIIIRNGLLGGLIASFVAFNIYYWVSEINIIDKKLDVNIIKFIFFGLIFGAIISLVFSMLESFYIEYLSGKQSGKQVPVSKWMMQGIEVHLGSSPGCHVVTYNDDSVADQHALMWYDTDSRSCFIKQLEQINEVYVNNRAIRFGMEYKIMNGDVILLGSKQQSKFRYIEKRG